MLMNATSVYYLCTKEPWPTFRDKTSIVVYKMLLLENVKYTLTIIIS